MNDEGKIEHEVSLHLLELGIKLYCRSTGDLVLHFPYPKVIYKETQLSSAEKIENKVLILPKAFFSRESF